MSLDSQPTAKPSGTLRNTLLIVSLCVNFLFIGVFGMGVARYFFWPPPPPEREAARDQRLFYGVGKGFLNPGMMADAVPDKAGSIAQTIDAHRLELRTQRRAAIAARADVLRLYLAEDFDKATFAAGLARVRAADDAFAAETMRVILDTTVLLNSEERRAVVERWRKARGHGWGNGAGGGRGKGPGRHRRGEHDGE